MQAVIETKHEVAVGALVTADGVLYAVASVDASWPQERTVVTLADAPRDASSAETTLDARLLAYGPCHLCGHETLERNGSIMLGCWCGAGVEICEHCHEHAVGCRLEADPDYSGPLSVGIFRGERIVDAETVHVGWDSLQSCDTPISVLRVI